MKRPVIVATRRSALALAQARAWMADFTRATGVTTEELHVVTTGDRIVDRALNEIGGKGLFIKEIEEAVRQGRADCAVHSLKDVPAELAPGLALACIPERADPRDAVQTTSGRGFRELPSGAKVGTSSLRRITQLKLLRPDLHYVPLRGNVDTRLAKCERGEVDAVIVAMAGLQRLGFADRCVEVLDPDLCLPAVGQGALAVECRADDSPLQQSLLQVNDTETQLAVWAERGVMLAVEGSCQVPVAAYATRQGQQIWLRAMLAEADGSNVRFDDARAPWPSTSEEAFDLGRRLGERLKAATAEA